MSISKKVQNYSSLLSDIKSSTLNDKIKGRNYKMYMKRVGSNNNDKSDLISLKSIQHQSQHQSLQSQQIQHSHQSSHIQGIQGIQGVSSLSGVSSEKIREEGSNKNLIDKRLLERRRNMQTSQGGSSTLTEASHQAHGLGVSNLLGTESNSHIPPNKIDIKISVNYGKSNPSLSTSKSFIHSNNIYSNPNIQTEDNLNFTSNKFKTPTNEKFGSHQNNSNILKEKLIKSLKSTISDEKSIKKKFIESHQSHQSHKSEINDLITNNQSTSIFNSHNSHNSANSNIHKRNQSENANFFQNNLNISLMNYENPVKNLYTNSYYNTPNNANKSMNSMNTSVNNLNSGLNGSFIYNPYIGGNNYNTDATPKRSNNGTLILDTNPKIDTLENINIVENSCGDMGEFTLNRNNNDFLQVVNNTVGSCQANQGNQGNNGNSNSINCIQTLQGIMISNNFKSRVNSIELKMEEGSAILNKSNNSEIKDKVSFSVKKFSIFKKSFEEYLKLLNNENEGYSLGKNMLNKILDGFNDTLQVVVNSYNKVNEKISDYDSLSTSKDKL